MFEDPAAPRHGLYNTTVALLKFLLAPLAICVVALFVELGIRFPARFALVDATPRTQTTSDGSFYVAFYGLHLFASYQSLTVSAFLYPSGQVLGKVNITIDKAKVGRESVFFSERFTLPDGAIPADYSLTYHVVFHGRTDYEDNRGPYTITYHRSQQCDDALLDSVPVFLREGQRAALPREWAKMGLRVVGINPGVSVEVYNNEPWIRSLPALRLPPGRDQEEFAISLQSTLFVSSTPPPPWIILAGAGQSQVRVPYNSASLYLKRCGAFPHLINASPGQRIAFVGPSHAATRILLTPTTDNASQTADVMLRLFVARNQAPVSVSYEDRLRKRVTLFTSWLFADKTQSYSDGSDQQYFNLNRYIIDPDGRNLESNEPDVRPKTIQIPTTSLFRLWRSQGIDHEVRLYLTELGLSALKALPTSDSSTELQIVVGDEFTWPALTLVVAKDVL